MTKFLPIVDVAAAPAAHPVPDWGNGSARSTAEQDRAARRARDRGIPLDNEAYNTLVLNYTMQCPLACDFCCYACGPHRAETMDQNLALSLVDQAADLDVFGSVSLTGGEPFLFHENMVELAKRSAQRGLRFQVITACAWATEDVDVDGFLRPFVDSGMTQLTVSHDPSHERWVSRDQIRRAVAAALRLKLSVNILGTFYDDQNSLEQLFPDYVDCPDISLDDRIARPEVGRRVRAPLLPSQRPNPALSSGDTCYQRVYFDVTVFWDGEVYPCCSVYNRSTPGISFGNVYDSPLSNIWDAIEGSLFMRRIKRKGYFDLFAKLEQRDPEVWRSLPQPLAAMDACHLCHLVMRDPAIAQRIRDVFDESRA